MQDQERRAQLGDRRRVRASSERAASGWWTRPAEDRDGLDRDSLEALREDFPQALDQPSKHRD